MVKTPDILALEVVRAYADMMANDEETKARALKDSDISKVKYLAKTSAYLSMSSFVSKMIVEIYQQENKELLELMQEDS